MQSLLEETSPESLLGKAFWGKPFGKSFLGKAFWGITLKTLIPWYYGEKRAPRAWPGLFAGSESKVASFLGITGVGNEPERIENHLTSAVSGPRNRPETSFVCIDSSFEINELQTRTKRAQSTASRPKKRETWSFYTAATWK